MSILIEMLSLSCLILIMICVGSGADPSTFSDQIGAKESRGQQHYAHRRLDCQFFCKKTGFSGYVGGCQCGFTLFANKRSDDNNANIGLVSPFDKINGNKHSRYGFNFPKINGVNQVLGDDHTRSDSNHFSYPYMGRLTSGRV